MKRLFICCDGTWNSPRNVKDGVSVTTNVHRFHCALAERDGDGNEQRSYYHPGVGTEGGKVRRAIDGATGTGLSKHIKGAYMWLVQNFEKGDPIYLLGFSRGAYTVRSLGGMVGRYGILPIGSSWDEVDALYDVYRRNVRDENEAESVPLDECSRGIHFIGVWDTVGSLGIPLRLNNLPGPLGRLTAKRNSFHDTRLSDRVKNAFHAVAIDEQREDFQPTLWSNAAVEGQRIEQVYFPGVHADVGGGYKERELADIPLDWMLDKAFECGAAFRPDMRKQAKPSSNNYQGNLHDSHVGVFGMGHCLPRSLPHLASASQVKSIHESVRKRIKQPPIGQAPYWPSRVLDTGEKSGPIRVFAQDRWNYSGLYLEPGEYRFSATGEWIDLNYKSGPAGSNDGLLRRAGALLKRLSGYKWLELIGCVANMEDESGITYQELFRRGREKPRHQDFPAWQGSKTIRVERPGYLYFFANDAWRMYWNNSGSVQVVVTCVRLGS